MSFPPAFNRFRVAKDQEADAAGIADQIGGEFLRKTALHSGKAQMRFELVCRRPREREEPKAVAADAAAVALRNIGHDGVCGADQLINRGRSQRPHVSLRNLLDTNGQGSRFSPND